MFSSLVWKFFFFGVVIFRSYCSKGTKNNKFLHQIRKNFQTRNNKLPHQRQNISAPVWKFFIRARAGWATCLVEPKKLLQYRSLLVLGLTPGLGIHSLVFHANHSFFRQKSRAGNSLIHSSLICLFAHFVQIK